MLQWVLKYQRLGLSVIPLRPKEKEPLYPWKEWQTKRADEEQIKKWWSAVPNANIGIVTGTISGIAVVDLDGPEGLQTATELGLRSTASYLTGNGKQLWYKYPTGADITIANSVKKLPGLDVRGEGGYVVAPPSVHPNGKRYRWINQINFIGNRPPFPQNMFAIGYAKDLKKKEYKEESWSKQNARLDIAKALEEMKDGNIDNTLVSVLGRLRHDNYSREDALAFLLPHCKRVGAEDGHLEAKIENIWGRYAAANEPKRLPETNSYDMSSGTLSIHSPSDNDSWEQFNVQHDTSRPILQTGFTKLDAMFTGGLKSERLFTVAALTGHGKTNFGIGLAKNLCEQSKTVLYFSTEFGYKKVWQRYIATLKNPQSFREHKLHVCDSFTPNIEQVEEAIIRIKPDVFIFDYIQHVSKEKEKLTDFMKGCQFLQRKYKCQGVILAQLNRNADWVEDGKRIEPRLSMIEGSATLEQASSRVLLLSMAKQLPEYYEIQGYLAKNDDGDTGMVQFALYRNPYYLREL